MPLHPLSFLVIEDHEFQRNLLVRLLQALGASGVQAAADGHAGLAILQDAARPVDIVICDLQMPGMDGMEFIRHVAGKEGPQVSLILLSAVDKKLLASIATMTKAYGAKLLGAAEKPLTADKLMELLQRYEAPRVDEGPRAGTPRQEFSQDEMAEGLARGEFEAFMQPKVELASGRVWGAEALARWRHPVHGIVGSAAFVPAMEQGGLIDALTWAMLEQSARWLALWQAAGQGLAVSVNLSLRSLDAARMSEHVAGIVQGQQAEPAQMVLEITESAAATDTARALENLARLRMLGFGLSIDDYGTGYSSMQQLSRIAFTELKIDRAFVAESLSDEATRVILASSLDMARKLHIHAVAEGVESPADWALLQQLGCDMAQGYLIGRPMEAERFQGWVGDWRREHAVADAKARLRRHQLSN